METQLSYYIFNTFDTLNINQLETLIKSFNYENIIYSFNLGSWYEEDYTMYIQMNLTYSRKI